MSSPLQNRVLPTGEIIAHPARGTVMGNRGGRIHAENQCLTGSRWKSKAWIICRLSFKGRQRRVMGSGYTELFFLDEATALAAGHRPCFECRRHAAIAFAQAFPGPGRTPAGDMDNILHAERRHPADSSPFSALPDGTMIRSNSEILLKWRGLAHPWQIEGYAAPRAMPDGPVTPLTPAATRSALANGYQPQLHPSLLVPPDAPLSRT